jgi:endonuclease/exonuclease/phosphatase family metal-dependent hydrolase
MKELDTSNLPVIFTGDLNSEPNDSLIQYLKTQLTDTREVSMHQPFGPSGSFNGFKHDQVVTMLIDYIFVSHSSPLVVNKYAILSDSKNLRYPSDHLPVYVELEYRKKK